MAFKSALFDDWRDEALCFNLVHKLAYFTQKELYRLFYPSRHANAAATRSAKRLCNEFCPVRDQCKAHALSTGDKFGVQGGLTADDRRRIRSAASGLPVIDYGEVEDYLKTG